MSAVIIIGAGPSLGATLAAVLRDSGVTVMVAERAAPALDALELGAALMHAVRSLPPELPPLPLPVLPLPVPKRWAGPILPPPRTGKRHREQRTKRGR